jgi:predicted N-acyltransferase
LVQVVCRLSALLEACYYQPLQWCIEGTAWPVLKVRGAGRAQMAVILPVKTTSAHHWLV